MTKKPTIDEIKQAFTDIFWLKSSPKNIRMLITIPEKDIDVFLDDPAKYLFDPLNLDNENNS